MIKQLMNKMHNISCQTESIWKCSDANDFSLYSMG